MPQSSPVEQIAQYFRHGCKEDRLAGFGVEIEHIPVRPETKEAVSYWGKDGIEEIMTGLSPLLHGQKIFSEGHPVGLLCADYSVTLEPAAQFEISIRPCMDIARIRQIYRKFRTLADPVFAAHSAVLCTLGYQPASRVDTLKLIPKKRYVYMDNFFQTSGTYGRHMMRGTASTQVSIDYISEADFVRKIRLAYLLGPLFSLLTDNTPVFEGAPVKGHLMRTRIWRGVDPARCGIIPGIEKEDFGFDAYAEFLWHMPLILKTSGKETRCVGQQTTAEVYGNGPLTEEDIAHIISMDFPDVRLKQYVEIRMADSLPEPLMASYAALIKGLFIDSATVKDLLARRPFRVSAIKEAQENLMENGFRGVLYGEKAACFAKKILRVAEHNLDCGEKAYLEPLFACAESGKTWAETLAAAGPDSPEKTVPPNAP